MKQHKTCCTFNLMHPDALLRFAAAHREFLLMEETIDIGNINRKEFNPMPALFTDDDVRDQIEISKELFLVVSCLQSRTCFARFSKVRSLVCLCWMFSVIIIYFYCCSRSSKTTVFNRSWTIWIYHQTAPISSKWSMQMAPCTHMFFVGMKRQALLLMAWLLHDTKEGTLPGHSLWTAVKTPFESFESFEFIWMLFQHLCTKPMPVTILIEDAKSVWISLVESRTVHRPQVAELCKSLSSCRLIDYMVQWCRTRSN